VTEIHIVSSPIGIFGVNDRGEIEGTALFQKDVEVALEALAALQRGEIVEEVKRIVLDLKSKGSDAFIFEDERLGNTVGQLLGVKVKVRKADRLASKFRARLPELSMELGFVETPAAFDRWVRDISALLAKAQIRKAFARRDLQVVQGVLALDDLDKTLNLYANRVREWYGLHFPELGNIVDKHETYLKLVLGFGNRRNFDIASLREVGFDEQRSKVIVQAASNSMGAEMAEEDLAQVKALSEVTLKMYEIRRNLESHLEELMEECAPNITGLIGSSIGARLLALAGGLGRLARMPASTIQVLGAEAALFRSLKTGSPPPKHGIIFQSPLVHQAERWQRGKIARALAGKLAIASRIDAFSDRDEGRSLRREVERRVEEIQKYKRTAKKSRGRRSGSKG